MCLDCQWLWQALCRPICPTSHNSHGDFDEDIDGYSSNDNTKGSTSDLSVAGLELPDEVNDVTSQDSHVIAELLQRLSSGEIDEQRAASRQLRFLAKESPEKKILIARAGSIPLLVNQLSTEDPETQEHSITTLLNLSIINANKQAIVQAGAIDAIVEVLKSGSMEARENAAATLFSLSVLDDNKVKIGKSQVFPALVDLLRDGTMRGRNDAASALFNMSLYDGNKSKVVAAGAVPPLVRLLSDSKAGMMEVSLAILSLLVTHDDGRVTIADADAIPALIELLKNGSPGTKEVSVAILLALSEHDPEQTNRARQCGAVSPLTEVARNGIPRGRKKANQLLDLLNKSNVDHDPQ